MSDEREPLFYTCDDDAESLTDTEPEEAVRCHLDAMLEPRMTPEQVLAALPKTITLYGYARTVLPPTVPDPDDVLDNIMERIEEDEYGDPDGVSWEDRMDLPAVNGLKAKARELCEAIRLLYKPWSCEQVTKEEVDVEKWIRENEPEWLLPLGERVPY